MTQSDDPSRTEDSTSQATAADDAAASRLLEAHLRSVFSKSRLDDSGLGKLTKWLAASAPFRDAEHLSERLASEQTQVLEPEMQQLLLDSLRGRRLTRRPFLAASIGAASIAALGFGIGRNNKEKPPAVSSELFNFDPRPLVMRVQQLRRTVGESVGAMLSSEVSALPDSAGWPQFAHALDMSNWLEAANYLASTELGPAVGRFAVQAEAGVLFSALGVLHRAWKYLDAHPEHWQTDYFVAYAFGKMPSLATPKPEVPMIPDGPPDAQEHAEAIHTVASLFHALEIMNQRFQQVGTTKQRAAVRVSQGHNFSYAHLGEMLRDEKLFPPNQRRVLVNWDAHADMSDPFENPRVPVADGFALLAGATNFAERVVAASSMSIAGWILPLVYEGLLHSEEQTAEVAWIVPREALATSHNCMEPYGTYSLWVGRWQVPEPGEFEQSATFPMKPWNRPGSTEIRAFSEATTLTSLKTADALEDRRPCTLHILDPEDKAGIARVLADARIALSVDVDYAGTREPGLSPRLGYQPQYLTESDEASLARHQQLLDQFGDFYERYRGQVYGATVVNSPNFTVAEQSRLPLARVLEVVTSDASRSQPTWVKRELERKPAPTGEYREADQLKRLLTVGGIAGILSLVGLLTTDHRRTARVRKILFAGGDEQEGTDQVEHGKI